MQAGGPAHATASLGTVNAMPRRGTALRAPWQMHWRPRRLRRPPPLPPCTSGGRRIMVVRADAATADVAIRPAWPCRPAPDRPADTTLRARSRVSRVVCWTGPAGRRGSYAGRRTRPLDSAVMLSPGLGRPLVGAGNIGRCAPASRETHSHHATRYRRASRLENRRHPWPAVADLYSGSHSPLTRFTITASAAARSWRSSRAAL